MGRIIFRLIIANGLRAGLLAGLLAGWGSGGAWAQGSGAGVELVPALSDTYLVTRDANVRAKAKTSSKRLGRVRKGTRVKVLGRARHSKWFALAKKGKRVGFVFGTILAPLIDGRLADEVSGKLSAKGRPNCSFTLQFTGKSRVEGELLETFDYDVAFLCSRGKRSYQFNATMFATEMPYLEISKPIYQLNLDVLNVPSGDRDVLSAIIMYHPAKKEILFDGLSDPTMGDGRKLKKRPAKTVRQALIGALSMGHAAWGPRLWAKVAVP